jgi:uncharacterized membrane protein/protein-disulfide isomerase
MTDQILDDLPSRTLTWCLRGTCAVALGVSGYLAWTALNQSDVLGCGDGKVFDCGHVLHSRWSKWWGIPVSIPALLMYTTTMFALIMCRATSNPSIVRFSWGIVTVFGVAAGIAAIWFISLQAFVIRSLCVYCLGVHTCGIIMSVLILRRRPLGKNMTSALSGLSVAAACVLVAGQLLSPQAPTYAIERYDTVDASDDDSVFALDGEEFDSDEFLAPTGELFDSPAEELSTEDEDRVSRLQTPTPSRGVGGRLRDSRSEDVLRSGVSRGPGTFGSEPVPISLQPLNVATTHDTFEMETGAFEANDRSGVDEDARVFVNPAHAPVPSFSPLPDSDNRATKDNRATAAQQKSTPSPSPSPPQPPKKRLVNVLGGRAQLDVRHWPLIGDLDSDYILVELFDYTCPHCRKMNEQINAARQRYGNRLAVVTLPVPLNRECNDAISSTKARHRNACELARFAIAVWRLDPVAFQSYHEWLFQPVHGRTSAEARSHAAQLVGNAKLNEELAKPIVSQFIAKHVELYKRSGKGTVPKLMFPKVTVRGQMNSLDALCTVLERELNIQR